MVLAVLVVLVVLMVLVVLVMVVLVVLVVLVWWVCQLMCLSLTILIANFLMWSFAAGQFRTNFSRFGHCAGVFYDSSSKSTVRGKGRRHIAIHCNGFNCHDLVDWFYFENQ